MHKLTIQPGLYFSPAAVDAMRAARMTDADVEADVAAFSAGVGTGQAAWAIWRRIARERPASVLAGILRMSADLVDGCTFYCDHKAEA
jgi:hypothetical protein